MVIVFWVWLQVNLPILFHRSNTELALVGRSTGDRNVVIRLN